MKTPKIVLGLALAAIALAQTGCVSLINKLQGSKFFADQPTLYSPASFITEKSNKSGSQSLKSVFGDALIAAQNDKATEKEFRTLLYAGVALIDYNYRRYIDAATQGRAAFGTAADITAIGLSTASTLMDPTGTKTILSGLSTAVQGSKASVEKHFYQDITTFIFISRMDVERSKVLAEIRKKLIGADGKLGALVTYSEVMVYLGQYYQAGTTLNALTQSQTEEELKAKITKLEQSNSTLEADIKTLKAAAGKATQGTTATEMTGSTTTQ
jgi:hypothetical protein